MYDILLLCMNMLLFRKKEGVPYIITKGNAGRKGWREKVGWNIPV